MTRVYHLDCDRIKSRENAFSVSNALNKQVTSAPLIESTKSRMPESLDRLKYRFCQTVCQQKTFIVKLHETVVTSTFWKSNFYGGINETFVGFLFNRSKLSNSHHTNDFYTSIENIGWRCSFK